MVYLVLTGPAAYVSVPHTHRALVVTGHQMVFVVGIVSHTAEGGIDILHHSSTKRFRPTKPKFCSTAHFMNRKVVGETCIPHNTLILKHLAGQK